MSVLLTGVNFSHLNSPDVTTGVSPLQVAIKTGNLRTVQVLLSANASREHLDNEANSVFHYAASTTKEIISVNICYVEYLCSLHGIRM
jgi:ankyrin repeat protein